MCGRRRSRPAHWIRRPTEMLIEQGVHVMTLLGQAQPAPAVDGSRLGGLWMLELASHPATSRRSIMSTLTLELSTSQRHDTANWAAVAFIASYSSQATRRTYTTQLRLWIAWCTTHHLD